MNKNKIRNLIYLVFTVLVVLNVLVNAPNLNPMYFEGAVFWCFLITVYLGVYAVFRYGEIIPISYGGIRRYSVEFTGGTPKKLFTVIAVPWVLLILVSLLSSPIFGSKAYRDQLGDPEVRTFSSDIQVMDQSQLPIVDKALAANLADKKLGERPSLGSQVYLGEPTKQLVNGKLVWVVPLHHSGLFKWFTNMSGTPGYVVVSATNINDVEYVEDYKIKYQPNSYLLDDLQRHLRLNGALFDGITDYSFELDESGQPYWIVTSYKNTRGFALPEAKGIYAVNASTGDVQYYSIDEVPDWVDRVQPEDFIVNQINNKGEYVHGIFNQMNGATEKSAQQSAQGKVQYQGYKADFPIILNVDGIPTYFMPLKDSAGLIKQYAFVSVTNYSSVGVGETVQDALRDYSNVLSQSGSSSIGSATGELVSAEGNVLRISSHVEEGITVYSILLDSDQNRIFTASASLSAELPITAAGDRVRVEYRENGSYVNGLESFDNLAFTQGEATAPTEPESTESAEEPAEEPAEVPAEETMPTEPETPAAEEPAA